jgi:hypothetical protein
MVYFQAKNPNLGKYSGKKFLEGLRMDNVCIGMYFMVIWRILWSFGVFYGHWVYFMVIWCILWSFGIFYGHWVCFMAIW